MNRGTLMMTKNRILWSSLLLVLTTTSLAALPDRIGDQAFPSLAPLVENASPAVVNIRVSQTVTRRSLHGDEAFRRFFGIPDSPGRGSREVASAGSGVIVDAERGYILTNHHVVENASKIQISLINGDLLDATIVGSDPATDIAVLQVEADNLTEMPFGDSNAIRVGDFVIAIGNPFGLGNTVTSGIISALSRRTGINRGGYEDFIQTDASINPGNSGGALVNMQGELVGINSAIISRSGGNVGIGFAVPAEIASSIMRQILDFGEVRRGLLGVSIQTIDAEAAKALNASVNSGALISLVETGSAAEKAGLKVDDIIVAVNDKKVTSGSDLRNMIGLMGSGEDVNIKYIRGGKTHTTTTILGQQKVTRIHPGLDGAQFAAASTNRNSGVEVTVVEPDSPASQRGLRGGDIIEQVNRQPVRTLQQLTEIASNSNILFLLVQRGDRTLMLQIR